MALTLLFGLFIYSLSCARLEYQEVAIFGFDDAIGAAGKALGLIQSLVSTSKTSKVEIGERQRGVGFSKLNITSTSSDTVYRKMEPMVEELTEFINGLNQFHTDIKQSGLKVMTKLAAGLVDSAMRQNIVLNFAGPTQSGRMDIAFIIFGLTPQDKWHCSTFKVVGSYNVAPDWYIKTTTKTKKGFFSSSETTTQEIVYVDRGVTQSDIGELLLISIPDFRAAIRAGLIKDGTVDGKN